MYERHSWLLQLVKEAAETKHTDWNSFDNDGKLEPTGCHQEQARTVSVQFAWNDFAPGLSKQTYVHTCVL